jgi:hypothetical protein
VVELSSGSSARSRPVCPYDGLPCNGPIIEGAPSCHVGTLGALGDENLYLCPRFNERARSVRR